MEKLLSLQFKSTIEGSVVKNKEALANPEVFKTIQKFETVKLLNVKKI